MNDHTSFNTPDDENAENALNDAASIIDGAASILDANNDGIPDVYQQDKPQNNAGGAANQPKP